MKRIGLFLFVLLMGHWTFAQPPTGFSYQAVVRDGDGNVLVNENVQLRIKLTGSVGTPVYYSEEHVTGTNAQGLVNVVIGHGIKPQGSIKSIPWSSEQVTLSVEMRQDNSEPFELMGSQPLQAVPYSLYATETGKVSEVVSDPDADDEEPIFVVRNKEGKVVFAVYQSGVRVYVDDSDTKRPKGGFAVGGYSNVHYGKEEEVNYLMVTPDSTRVSFRENEDGGKRPKGGFAVGGYSGAHNYLNVTPSHTQISFADDGTKRPKGGFAVGGYSNSFGKEPQSNYFTVTPDSTRVSFREDDDDGGKRPKGGFAVGGYSGAHNYLNVTPSHTQISFADDGTKRPKGGFAVGGYSNSFGKEPQSNYFTVTPDSTRVSFREDDDDGGKRPKGGFAVGGYSGAHNYLNVTPTHTQVSFADDDTKRPKGGFAVGGYSNVNYGKEPQANYLTVTPDSTKVSFREDDDGGKRPKGGFAVGGYSGAHNYLNVTPSHTQVSFDADNTGKRPKGGFAVGGFSSSFGKSGEQSFFDITTDATGVIDPAENRVLWYPQKNALMAGKVLVESADEVGENSFSAGYENKAKGEYSQAMGYKAQALGDYSTAIGNNAVAQSVNSFAFGEDAQAQGEESYAIGRGAKALGKRSVAIGSIGRDSLDNETPAPIARSDYSFAIGQGAETDSWSVGAFAIGLKAKATTSYSLAIGYNARAVALGATSVGYFTQAQGLGAVALGWFSKALSGNAFAVGGLAKATGSHAVAIGEKALSTGTSSIAIGANTSAAGTFSVAIGSNTKNSDRAHYSTATGINTETDAYYAFTGGQGTTASSSHLVALGRYNVDNVTNANNSFYFWNAADPIFEIGIGTSVSNRKNAITVLKNGRVGLQSVTKPDYALELPNNSSIGIGKAQATEWLTHSDTRIKSNQQPIRYGLAQVMRMVPKTYFHHNSTTKNGSIAIAPEGKQEIGLVAQEMYDIVPEAVSKPENEQAELWGLSYEKLVPVLIKAIQEQQEMMEEQQRKMDLMQKEIELLKQK